MSSYDMAPESLVAKITQETQVSIENIKGNIAK